MTSIERDDGTAIHYDATGAGPQVLLANVLYGHPGLFAGLIADLARDHRVITYDLRGTGASTRRGPYDLDVDLADLEALLEQLGGVRAIVAIGDATLRAVRMAAARPDLVGAVVAPGTFLVAQAGQPGGGGLSGSGSVLSALGTLLAGDYRAGIRSIVESGNPGMAESEIRERVEQMVAHCPREPGLTRFRTWTRDDASREARAIGGRLWVLPYPGNPWFPQELADQMPDILPEANRQEIGDGPWTRPEDTAAVVRQITGGAGPARS
jgi:pimeloyl-ACP methyl ester carboxylesterase